MYGRSSASVVEMHSTLRASPRNIAGTEPAAALAITSSSGSTNWNSTKTLCAPDAASLFIQNSRTPGAAATPVANGHTGNVLQTDQEIKLITWWKRNKTTNF